MSEEFKEEKLNYEKQIIGKDNKKLKWILIGIMTVILIIGAGMGMYDYNLSIRAKEQLDLGIKYLLEGNYEQAIICFNTSISIDPNNKDIRETVEEYMDELYQVAREYGKADEYAAEKEIAVFMLTVDEEHIGGKLADAEADLGLGNIQAAKDTYQNILEEEKNDEEAKDGILICDILLKIIENCKLEKWDDVLSFINQEDVTSTLLDKYNEKEFLYKENGTIKIIVKDNSIIVYSGDEKEENGIGMISAVNVNAIYEGAWKSGLPGGEGKVQIWNKNEGKENASVYIGNFEKGVLQGEAELNTKINNVESVLNINIENGQVIIYKIDDKGNVWLTEKTASDGSAYIVKYLKEKDGVLADYIAGVPALGGSDMKLEVSVLDVVPPVIICTLPADMLLSDRQDLWDKYGIVVDPNHSYIALSMNVEGKGVTATDNVDGDITDKITYKSTRGKNSEGYEDEWFYGLRVEYTAVDSAGNIGILTVNYDIALACGFGFSIVSMY